MASNAYLFLDRIFTKDKPKIDALVEYYVNSNKKYQVFQAFLFNLNIFFSYYCFQKVQINVRLQLQEVVNLPIKIILCNIIMLYIHVQLVLFIYCRKCEKVCFYYNK